MKMKIEVAPYTISPFCNPSGNEFEDEENDKPVACWGVYIDGKCAFFTSSRESAEKIKIWMEKCLKEGF